MSNLTLDLNENNWELVSDSTHSAEPIPNRPNTYRPLPEVIMPILLDRRILAIGAYSASAAPHWKFACFLNQKLQTGLTVGGLTDSYTERKRIYLNRINLIFLPPITSTYAVTFSVPYWILNIRLIIWKYIGVESYSTEGLIQEVKADVLRVESKIDSL